MYNIKKSPDSKFKVSARFFILKTMQDWKKSQNKQAKNKKCKEELNK